MLNRNDNVKIFDFNKNILITFINSSDEFKKLQKAYDYFDRYYNIPIINADAGKTYFLEKYLQYKPYKIWNSIDRDKAISEIYSSLLKQINDKRKIIKKIVSVRSMVDELLIKISEKALVNRLQDMVPLNKYNDLWPIIRCHGDLNFDNILLHEENFYFIDWEDSSECIFFYDFLNCIFVEAMYQNDCSLLEQYRRGNYDKYLTDLFTSMSVDYCSENKDYYLALYIIERLLKFEIVKNKQTIDDKLKLYIEFLKQQY